eukprot:GHRQ01032290.1.p1 GENE.GHRQ01032290.1~~GHRQ01032290.1.p1  ORF type:complete len:119 (-),score=7.30 GHRQ01032290.1:495-851(-)
MLLTFVCRARPNASAPALAGLYRWSHTYAPSHVPVVVVGAGPTGLVLSCLLSQYGKHSNKRLTKFPDVAAQLKLSVCCRNSPYGAGTVTAADAAPTGTLHQQQNDGGTTHSVLCYGAI